HRYGPPARSPRIFRASATSAGATAATARASSRNPVNSTLTPRRGHAGFRRRRAPSRPPRAPPGSPRAPRAPAAAPSPSLPAAPRRDLFAVLRDRPRLARERLVELQRHTRRRGDFAVEERLQVDRRVAHARAEDGEAAEAQPAAGVRGELAERLRRVLRERGG